MSCWGKRQKGLRKGEVTRIKWVQWREAEEIAKAKVLLSTLEATRAKGSMGSTYTAFHSLLPPCPTLVVLYRKTEKLFLFELIPLEGCLCKQKQLGKKPGGGGGFYKLLGGYVPLGL